MTILGMIGFGAMGSAIGRGLVGSGALPPADLVITDAGSGPQAVARELGVQVAVDAEDLVGRADIVLMAVKPVDAMATLRGCAEAMRGKALVSIVAGLSHDHLQATLGPDTRVLRVMPNTPAMVGAGAYGLSTSTTLTEQEKAEVGGWFSSIGLVEWVREDLLDAVTGLSGGGPAYVALIIEALADGGVQAGLKREVALRLATQTVLGTAQMVQLSGQHPAVLKDAVCSPGGTTIEGMRVLEAAGVRSGLIEAVIAASDRSRELGN